MLASKPSPAPHAKVEPSSLSTKSVQSPAPISPKAVAGEAYTIKAGDTLSKLAERYYGAHWKWGQIYEANRERIKNPDYIYIGQKITIPADDPSGT
jgi:nucleoid-associated protein YgaU